MKTFLDIGSGAKPHKGYQTIEIQDKFQPDYCGDFRKMDFNEVDGIRAHHLLEHFGRGEVLRVLKLWHKWLKVGGTLIVETPDFEGIAKSFIETSDSKKRYWLTRHAHGSQDGEWAYHRDAFWEGKYREILPLLGYEIINVKHSVSRKYLPNITVTARKI